MDAKTQYLQYKQPLKKQCIVQIVASAVALLATVFLLFLPNFSIDTLTVLFAETTLPKLHDEAAFMGSQINFSIWDEFYAVIAPVTGEDSTARTLALSFGFLQILGIIFLAVGLIMALVSVIRNIMHILSLENYALETYDKLKKRTEKRGRRGYFSSPTYWIIIGFVYEVMAVLLSIYLTDLTEGSIVTSYFSVMSGLAASGYITILFMLAAVVLVIVGGQMKLQTPGNGKLEDVIYHVYGRDVALRLIEVDRAEGPLRIRGFIGKPELSRGNRNYENYFVNGRFVRSKIVAKGIEDGYKTFMMQHRYPFVCLDLQVDGRLLDVNVHPSKMEIRFSNQNLVYDLLQRTVKDTLSGKELIPEVKLAEEPKRQESAARPWTPESQKKEERKVPLEKMWKTPEPVKEPVTPQEKNLEYFMAQMRKRVEERHMVQEENGYGASVQESPAPKMPVPETPVWEKTVSPEPAPVKTAPEQMTLFDGKMLSKEAAVRHEIIGQVFDTYWLVQYADKLYIIDQHAAHEKVLYERLMKNLKERAFQQQILSPPIILNLSMQEEELFLRYRSCFAEMGFEIEEFGDRAYAVRAVPADLPGMAQNEILMEFLDSLSDITGNVSSESLMDRVATMSCNAAMKGNHRMSAAEAKALIDELLTLENPYNCPHGRPTIIAMTKYELEKKFKRIV